MFASTSLKLNKELWAKVVRCAEAAGYSSPQEFVEHVLEKEIGKIEEEQSNEEIVKKLQGLGYLD